MARKVLGVWPAGPRATIFIRKTLFLVKKFSLAALFFLLKNALFFHYKCFLGAARAKKGHFCVRHFKLYFNFWSKKSTQIPKKKKKAIFFENSENPKFFLRGDPYEKKFFRLARSAGRFLGGCLLVCV